MLNSIHLHCIGTRSSVRLAIKSGLDYNGSIQSQSRNWCVLCVTRWKVSTWGFGWSVSESMSCFPLGSLGSYHRAALTVGPIRAGNARGLLGGSGHSCSLHIVFELIVWVVYLTVNFALTRWGRKTAETVLNPDQTTRTLCKQSKNKVTFKVQLAWDQ